MLGKRPRQMRRTVSVSMLGTGSSTTLPECPKDKQKPHLEMPECCNTQRQEVVSSNYPVSKLGKEDTESSAYYLESVPPCSPSESRPWWGKEGEAVGLGIVAALHADTKMEVKDNRGKVLSAVTSHRSVYRNNFIPSVRQSLASPLPRKQLPYQDIQTQTLASSYRKFSSGSHKNENVLLPPATHFLEACCYCKRRLSHGRDIYMYRGDKAFCSEHCRDEQISIDERKEKHFLTALRMKTSAQTTHSSSQGSRALVTGTAAG